MAGELTGQEVTVDVVGGPTMRVGYEQGMNVRRALERADEVGAGRFTFAIQYFAGRGYLLMMINENYDSFDTSYEPDFYWSLRVNGAFCEAGIDGTVLEPGDVVSFEYARRVDGGDPLVEVKRGERRSRLARQP